MSSYDLNIAKGTTDPRVEFTLPYQSNNLGHITICSTNLDQISFSESRLSMNFKIKIMIIIMVDLQAMFDKRVKKLFEEEVRCPGELDQIKKNYM